MNKKQIEEIYIKGYDLGFTHGGLEGRVAENLYNYVADARDIAIEERDKLRTHLTSTKKELAERYESIEALQECFQWIRDVFEHYGESCHDTPPMCMNDAAKVLLGRLTKELQEAKASRDLFLKLFVEKSDELDKLKIDMAECHVILNIIMNEDLTHKKIRKLARKAFNIPQIE